jgi:hypothetical protein
MDEDDRPFGSAARLSYDEPEVKIEDIQLKSAEMAMLDDLLNHRDRLPNSRGTAPKDVTGTVKRRSDRIQTIHVKRLEAEVREIEARLYAPEEFAGLRSPK